MIKTLAIPIAIFAMSFMTSNVYASGTGGKDQFGISVAYNPAYSQAGCSDLAWKQTVANYQSKVNTFNENAKGLNQAILNSTLNPGKFNLGGCTGSAKDMYDSILSNAKTLMSQLKNIKSFNLNSIASSLVDNLTQQIFEQACKAASGAIDQGLNGLGITEITSQFGNLSQNPFGFAMKTAGIDGNIGNITNQLNSSSVNEALGKEFQNLIQGK